MRRIATVSCLVGLLGLGVSGSAGAATFTPASGDFGSQTVGTTSAPKSFVLGLGGDPAFTPGLALSGPFTQTNDCPALLVALVTPTCTVNVSFAPTNPGTQSGTLTSISVVVGAPSAALSGTGTESGAAAKKCTKKKGGKKKGKKGAIAAKKKGGKKSKCKKKKKKKGGKKK